MVALAAAVFFASATVVWLGDDIDYAYFISSSIWDSHGPIDSLKAFFGSQGNHYVNVNGRAVAHTIVQFFCGITGQTFFAVCNALVYPLFVFLIARTAGTERPFRNPGAVLSVALMTLLCFVTKMMPTTQIGFVWMFTLNLLWLVLLKKHSRRLSDAGCVMLCLLGILAGNGQEALSLGISVALGIEWLRSRKDPRTTIAMAGYWIGTAALCLSPGTLGRAEAAHIALGDSLVYTAMSLRATYILAVILAWEILVKRHLTVREFYHKNSFFVNAMAVLAAFNLIIGVYSNRQLFGMELMALIMVFRILPGHCFNGFWTAVSATLVTVIFISQMMLAGEVRRQYDEIRNLYTKSDNGIIYYDRTLATSDPFFREWRYYEEIIGQFNNDTHHSLQKKLRKETGRKKSVHVWPTAIKGHASVRDTAIEYAPGHFLVLLTDAAHHRDSTERVPAVRTESLFGQTATDTIEVSRAIVKGAGWKGAIILPSRPFSRPIGVETVPGKKTASR